MYDTKSIADILQSLNTSKDGLTKEQAAKLLEQNGPNSLKEKDPPTTLQRFFSQLRDPMIYILLAAVAISLFLGEFSDAAIILCVILLNAVIGVVQEGKAQKALDALKKMSSPIALVRRSGLVFEVPAQELVCGDIVLLDAGRIIPADIRIIEGQSLKVEESALTGESVPVEKDASFIANGDISLGDKINMGFMSTSVSYGRGEGVVIATAENTEIGKIATMINNTVDEMTPLQKRLADLGRLLGIITIVVCAALFAIAIIQQRNIIEMLITAISLAVAAVPEGLPAVVTIVLAIGVQRMVKINSIVRRLPAVETLGAVSVVCSDKTGTLTQNKMTVTKIYGDGILFDVSELRHDERPVLCEGFILCNDASVTGENRVGDPTELALIDLGIAINQTRPQLEQLAPRINERAFDSDRKLMTTVHNKDGTIAAYTKGKLSPLSRQIFQKHRDTLMLSAKFSACSVAQHSGRLKILRRSFRGYAARRKYASLG